MIYTLTLLFLLLTLSAHAQSVMEIALQHRSDEIPSRTSGGKVKALFLLPKWTSLETGYQVQSASMDEAYGFEARSLSLHSLYASYALPIVDGRIVLSGGPRFEMRAGDSTTFHLGYVFSIGAAILPEDGDVSLHASLTADRAFYQAGYLAIEQDILRDQVQVRLTGSVRDIAHGVVSAERLFLSDKNVIDNLSAYVLFSLFRVPDIQLGYAFQTSNARTNRWSLSESVRDANGSYTYTYFYVPYFTPLREEGHIALGSIRYSLTSWCALRARAAIPITSSARRLWTPETGATPFPVVTPSHFKEKDIVQTTIVGALDFELAPTRWLSFEVEHFDKPYYTYTQALLKYTMTF